MDLDQWDDLLLSGGFAPRHVLLRGLTLAEVSTVPPGLPHSIYQELWHAATVLDMSLKNGRVVLETWPYEEHFPTSAAPASQDEWNDLVALFLDASARAVRLSHETGWLESAEPVYDTSTWRDAMEFLAVHTAYHLGKIVALRQSVGAWPPRRDATPEG